MSDKVVGEPKADEKKQLLEIVRDFDNAMLVTADHGGMQARPMAVASIEENGDIYFSTDVSSPKAHQIADDPHVAILFQGKLKFAAVYGKASVVQDRALVERLWKPDWKVWFPKGKDDPSLCLIRVSATHGQYWDNSGAKGIKYVIEVAKALVKKTTPDVEKDQTAKVSLRKSGKHQHA